MCRRACSARVGPSGFFSRCSSLVIDSIPTSSARGATGTRMAIFVSTSGHYSAKKAAALLGIGTDAVIPVDASPSGVMIPAALAAAIDATIAGGRQPLAVVATRGNDRDCGV